MIFSVFWYFPTFYNRLSKMPISVPIILVFELFHSADNPQPHFDAREAQRTLISHALNARAIRLAGGDDVSDADICTWKAIDCTDSLATAIKIRCQSDNGEALVDIEWLPPTLQFIHMTTLRCLTEWSLTSLPRELKFLYLAHCGGIIRFLDCALLPEKMEELILVGAIITGGIRFESMPQEMRYVYVMQVSNSIIPILVNYSSLPASLQEIRMLSVHGSGKIKRMIQTVGEPGAVKLKTKYDEQYPRMGSRYPNMFEAEVM